MARLGRHAYQKQFELVSIRVHSWFNGFMQFCYLLPTSVLL